MKFSERINRGRWGSVQAKVHVPERLVTWAVSHTRLKKDEVIDAITCASIRAGDNIVFYIKDGSLMAYNGSDVPDCEHLYEGSLPYISIV